MNPLDQELNFDVQPIMPEKDVKLHDRPAQLDVLSITNYPSRRSFYNRSQPISPFNKSTASSALIGLQSQSKLLDFDWGEDNTFPILGSREHFTSKSF